MEMLVYIKARSLLCTIHMVIVYESVFCNQHGPCVYAVTDANQYAYDALLSCDWTLLLFAPYSMSYVKLNRNPSLLMYE